MSDILERVIFIIILIITTYHNITLGCLVCFIIIVIYLNKNIEEGFNTEGFNTNIISNDDDCNAVKIPNVNVITTTSYTAIMVEPRKHKALLFVMQNFTENLSEDWNFIIYHGKTNEKLMKYIVSKLSANVQNRITLINLNVKNINIAQYSTMFFCPTFYDNIPTETFLIFQTDSMILKENKNKIYDFMKYDYVGAPWPKTMGRLGKMGVGNGGLSLRKKSKMVELLQYKEKGIENGRYGKYMAEDQFFCGFFVREVNVYKPTFIKAKDFSIEAVYSEKPFGVHKLWSGITSTQLDHMFKKYPEIKILTQLNT